MATPNVPVNSNTDITRSIGSPWQQQLVTTPLAPLALALDRFVENFSREMDLLGQHRHPNLALRKSL